jgi:hypothetical protein
MKIPLAMLRWKRPTRIIIDSVDLSLYIALAEVRGRECLLLDDAGRPLKARSLADMKRALAGITYAPWVLRQRSAYDEMVGHAHAATDNALEVPVSHQRAQDGD